MKKNTKGAKGNQDFLKSNVETGAHNWNWAPNYGSSRMNQEEISNYKKQQLANAKKVGGGILNTNVETGNWHGMQFIVPEKSDPLNLIITEVGDNQIMAKIMEIIEMIDINLLKKSLIIIISMKKDFSLHNKEIIICNIIKIISKIMNRDIIQKVMNKIINKKIINKALIKIMKNQILIN